MRSFAVAALSLISLTAAERICRNVLEVEEVDAIEAQFGDDAARAPKPTISPEIKVYWHVVNVNTTLEGGNVPKKQIEDQISVLVEAYASTGLSFTLAGIDRTTNQDWFDNADLNGDTDNAAAAAMKRALHKGGKAALNFYSVGFTASGGLLGYAAFPWEVASKPKLDGVVIHYASLPGGTFVPYDLGQTATHEAGHWVGLYHTFQGGCGAPGDSVSDTPAEAGPNYGCPTKVPDSCPGKKGLDPIHNYMDYSDDICLTEFSAGQVTRLQTQMTTYRGIKF